MDDPTDRQNPSAGQAPERLRVGCPCCDATGHRCDYCDGDGWLYADELEPRAQTQTLEFFNVSL